MVSPDDVIKQAEREKTEAASHLREFADWFHTNEGELFTRDEAYEQLSEEFGVDNATLNSIIAGLTGDVVDPIVQIHTGGERYIGVIDYVEGDGWYGYTDYDDVDGKARTAVCAQCVHESEKDIEVTFAREGVGSFADGRYSYEELSAAIELHYADAHEGVTPEEVETGATLVSGTTIGGNTAWHSGNDGDGSGLVADSVGGTITAYRLVVPVGADMWG